jgi:polyhydroxybutyrate depolymerase
MPRWLLLSTLCAVAIAGACYLATEADSALFLGGFQQLSMQVAGQQRTYLMLRPAASGRLPTVLYLHGFASSAEKMRNTKFGPLGASEGFVTVLPDGLDGIWNVFPPGVRYRNPRRYGWQVSGTTGGADVAFIKQLVGDLIARGIADPSRVYLGGVSLGGFMTLRMACVAPELFAAVGVVLSSMPDPEGQVCHPSKSLPLVMINGTADEDVPYAGGMTRGDFSVWGTDRTLAFFRNLNGCTDAAERSEVPQTGWGAAQPIVVQRWTACTRAPVVLYAVVGGGHRTPGTPGAFDGGFDAPQALWDFFRDKRASNN